MSKSAGIGFCRNKSLVPQASPRPSWWWWLWWWLVLGEPGSLHGHSSKESIQVDSWDDGGVCACC